ncbi:MAG: hypothetical protein ACM3X7_00590 [Solirubrobacterales bacterium]
MNEILDQNQYTNEDIKLISEYVRNSKALDYCNCLASGYSKRAIKLIHSLPQNKNKALLLELTERLLYRNY